MKTLTLIIIISLLLSACGSDSKSESSEPLAVLPPEETILEPVVRTWSKKCPMSVCIIE